LFVPESRINAAVVAGTLILIAIVLGVVALGLIVTDLGGSDRIPCDDYKFDAGEWRDHKGQDESSERQADALVRCATLIGMTRAEVAQLLGPHDTRGSISSHRRWVFFAGDVNDGFGPGDALSLYVYFNAAGRVTRAKLSEQVEL
jgi:hypothetical protein